MSGNACSLADESCITPGQRGPCKIEAAARADGGMLTLQMAKSKKRDEEESAESEILSSRFEEPVHKKSKSSRRWIINHHLESHETGPSCGNGLFARKPLPAGWTFLEHPICVKQEPSAIGRERRLPAASDLDELMAEVSRRALTGSLVHERLLHGPWAMSYVPEHYEMQDTVEAELPDWSRELGLQVNQYNTLAAQLQSNVARVHDGDDSGLVLNPILRLCNHSCAPNAQLAWTAAPSAECPCGVGQFRLLALQDIGAGVLINIPFTCDCSQQPRIVQKLYQGVFFEVVNSCPRRCSHRAEWLLTLHRVCAVLADEEIRYTYIGTPGIDAPLSADRRRALLQRRWGFWCGCSMCASE
uniref:SET domain-containing protein n=1 Tax=Chrysotila carterae TaxID=13221 RepID=A0A7S4B9U3_CHRCT